MAMGKFHDRFNLFCGALVTGYLIGVERSVPVVIMFAIGWLIATLVFSPDTDLTPKKRTAILQFFLYPYSIMFKHRGISHNIFLGTLSRLIYGACLLCFLVLILAQMGYLELDHQKFFYSIWEFIRQYNYDELSYKMISWFFLGMFTADFCHVAVDKFCTVKGKLLKLLHLK